LLIAVGIQVLIGIVARLLHLANGGAFLDPKRLILGDWVATFIPIIIATLVMMRIERRTLGDYYIPVRGPLGKSFWVGALWGIAAVSLLMGLIALAGGYRIAGVALHAHVAYWVLIWLAAASIGIVEEIAFRGYMLRTLADGIGFWPAACVSFLFCALHYFAKPHERWEDFASTGLLALFMSLTIARTGNLAWAMGWHFGFDWGAIWVWSGRNAGEYAPGRLFQSARPRRRPRNWRTARTRGELVCVYRDCCVIRGFSFHVPAEAPAKYLMTKIKNLYLAGEAAPRQTQIRSDFREPLQAVSDANGIGFPMQDMI
jgi:membrane protease YdiL (CAAX protease family)